MKTNHFLFLQQAISAFIKRGFDIIFSILVLTLTFPLLILIAFCISCSSKGLFLYKQTRIGKKGKPFTCYKFRTMQNNAEDLLQDILENNPLWKEEWELFCKLKQDPRVTFVGRFLRKTSLDELPQFWNVLKGDLSVVGPRPMLLQELEKYAYKNAEKILSVKPGITGLSQLYGRALSMENRLALAEKYIEKRSFFLDIRLIIKTIPHLFFSKDAC